MTVCLAARSSHGQWQDTLARWEQTSDPSRQRELERSLDDLQQSTADRATTFNVLVASAGAFAVTAAVLLLVDRLGDDTPDRADRSGAAPPTVAAAPGGVEVRF